MRELPFLKTEEFPLARGLIWAQIFHFNHIMEKCKGLHFLPVAQVAADRVRKLAAIDHKPDHIIRTTFILSLGSCINLQL